MAELESLRGDLPTDPDAQATVTDFLDYTEYLPSDLVRSLRLIGDLDDAYLSSADNVHKQSKVYGSLPGLSPAKRPSSQYLRQEISYNLDHAINTRECAYAEASRLFDQVDRHYSRLSSIISKLQALPKPPSRDPTPVPRVRSPQISRVRTRGDGTPPPRITLRLDGARNGASGARIGGSPVPKSRYRSQKVTVPGEVLPPPNPDSPPPITDSEWEIGPISPVPVATSRVGASSRNRPIKPARIRTQKSPNLYRMPKISRAPRPPGAMGTNVHSAVAGISTSNALSLLDPPPADAKPGSLHAPWMRLTEWEMAKLRKRMKKNAIWSPSETMIRRELADAGRGPDNYRATKARCDEAGEDFLDEDHIATSLPGKPLAPGEISSDALSLEHSELSNRGMKLNEAKKAKRETMAREQAALAAAEAELAAKRLADIGSSMKSLFNKPIDGTLLSPLSPITPMSQTNGKATSKEKARAKEREKEKEKARELERQRQKDAEEEAKRQMEREEQEKRKEEERERQMEEERQREREAEIAREEEKERERQKQMEIEAQEKQRALEEERQKEQTRLEEAEKEKQRQKEIEMASRATTRKRKRDPSPQPEITDSEIQDTAPKAPLKRSKVEAQSLSPKLTTRTVTTVVPLAAPAPPSTPLMRGPPTPTATSTRTRRQSLTLKGPAPPPPPISTEAVRSSSRPSSRRGSTGPPSARLTRDRHPRKSTTPAATPTSVPPTPVMTAASRRSKRPAPGPVTSVEEGAPAVSTGKRKNAPRKRGTAAAANAAKKAAEGSAKAKEQETRMEEDAAGEEIDPDEPRYCICGDVSWGDMICCENNEVMIPPRTMWMKSHHLLTRDVV
ncbi:hypothetical protein G7Y79_00004g013990 [Physcia stellaris]|nr:hypothetical protein G7Y79_00004g013990 [Physcia stellaris]